MASRLIGRTRCPECDEPNAHVKRSEKTLYRHCPTCGSQYMATGEHREGLLMAKTRLDKPLAVAAPTAPDPVAESPVAQPADSAAPPTPAAPTPAPRKGLFGMREG